MYSRFKALKSFDEEDLDALQNSSVAVVGLGATGSVIAEHLARHGVNLIIIDRDYLEPNDCYSSNLYPPEECEQMLPKAEVAAEKLGEFTEVRSEPISLNPENVSILDDADIVLDGTDNMETRFLIDEYCAKNGKPWIYTAALGEKGYSMAFDSKCYSCVFEEVSAGTVGTCETDGILREVSTIAASISARKAVNYLTGKELDERLDAVHLDESFEVESSKCDVCRGDSFPHLESERSISSVCGENKYEIRREIPEEALERIKTLGEDVEQNSYLVRALVDGHEFVAFRSGRAIIEAEDRGHAEELFAEVVGV